VDWGAYAALGGLILGIPAVVALMGALPKVFRSAGTRATLELQATEIDAERKARLAQAERYEARIREMERRSASEVGELRGRIDSLQLAYAKAIAADVAREVIKLVQEELALARGGSPHDR
jgi:hypothetical protein